MADARGSSAANNALGKARADAVKAAQSAQGVDASRIETVSGGEADPSPATAPRPARRRTAAPSSSSSAAIISR